MKSEKKKAYIAVQVPEGADVYCPRDAVNKPSGHPVAEVEECVEKDVVKRYSGNIDIRNH